MTAFLKHFTKFNLVILLSACATWTLFFVMQLLITNDFEMPDNIVDFKVHDITMPELEFEIVRETPKPVREEELEPPPELEWDEEVVDVGGDEAGPRPPVFTQIDTFSGEQMLSANTDALPIVQIQPTYPSRALNKGIEGYVIIEFNVDEGGVVVDPRVLYAEPEGYFERASLQAMARWRYKPKLDDGRPVKMFGLQQKLSFNMEQ